MGLAIERSEFDEHDRARFDARLHASLAVLRTLLQRPGFGEGPASLGAEVELDLVDAEGRPAPCNRAVLAATRDPRITHEVDRFNLEINSTPVALAGRPFTALHDDLVAALAEATRAAATVGARPIAIGILPTLREQDLHDALTEVPRYRALSAALRAQRPGGFALHIEGPDTLALVADDVTFEGANTSFQLHVRVPPPVFASHHHAAQLASAPVLALSGNAPLLLGRRLWDETRIALFRQSVDERAQPDDWRPARVSFGHGWVRHGAYELFAESVALHQPLLPVCGDEDPAAVLARGGIPTLAELRLHHGTVWRWNRAVYDSADGGHLRIELRALPAGPTVVDMIANGAFLAGLVLALAPRAEHMIEGLTFSHARQNFYEAARRGPDATLLWPPEPGARAQPIAAPQLVARLLPVAQRGLEQGGVATDEAARWLDVVAERNRSGITGARWQRAWFDALARSSDDPAAALVQRYLDAAASGAPVHTWPMP
ncbi:MAG: glutamate--cysteine ligase [Nannocystaceae bacterium]|nr:glutamate--cysteine ligase [Nannocystaceae bacterium]